MMRTRQVVWSVLAAAALLGSSCGGRSDSSSAGSVTPIHKEAAQAHTIKLFKDPVAVPAFTVTTLDGRRVSLADLKGKVVLVNFWATWCPPCRAEIPDLMELQARYKDKLVVLGMSEDDPPVDTVTKFVAAQKMTYPVAMSTPDVHKIFKGIVALPTTFVIGPDGTLQQKHVGQLNAADTETEARVLAGLDMNASIERVENSDKARLMNAAQARTIPGVDLTKLSEDQRKTVVQAMIAEDCTCGCGLTVGECRIDDPTCPISLPLAKEIVKKYSGAPAN
jgi:cytochrome c biogenesis protein CcmG/thiol:disulfide interchange protein DsbE